VLTIAVLMALGQFEPGTPLGDLLARSKVSEPEQPPEAESESPLAVEPAPDQPSAEVESAPGPAVEPQQPALSPEAAPSQPAQAVEKPAVQEPPAAAPAEPSTPPTDAGPAVETAKTAPPAVAATDRPPEATAVEPAVEPAKTPEATDSLPPEPLGRLMSTDQVLLKHDATAGWTRAAPNEMLTPQRLLCLPTYRAKVALTVGVSLEILGGTRLDLLPSSPQDLPGVRIEYGRVGLMPLAQAGSRVRVAFGDRSGVVTFSDAASIASFEVRRLHPPGADPEASPPHIVADLFCTSGGLSWEEPGKTEGPLELKPPQRISFDADLTSAPFAPKEMPKWIEAEPISQLDRKASAAIAQPQALPTDRPARLALLELFTTRPQKEVKWLALRCLSHIGQFADMTAVLNDPDQKLDWSKYVDQLREAVSRDAESAAAVRLALEKQYPQQAAQLYRMLWGYDNKDLEAGADAELVKALADDMLAVRVLSHWNLKDLTGLGLFYRPEQTAALRQQPIRRWKERLDAGEIRLKNTEEKAGAADNVSPPEN